MLLGFSMMVLSVSRNSAAWKSSTALRSKDSWEVISGTGAPDSSGDRRKVSKVLPDRELTFILYLLGLPALNFKYLILLSQEHDLP